MVKIMDSASPSAVVNKHYEPLKGAYVLRAGYGVNGYTGHRVQYRYEYALNAPFIDHSQ